MPGPEDDREYQEDDDRAEDVEHWAIVSPRVLESNEHMSHLRPVHAVEPLVTRAELALLLHMSEDTIDEMRKAGMPSIPWGRRLVRFEASACLAWLKNRRQEAA